MKQVVLSKEGQGILEFYIEQWGQTFLTDCKIRGLSEGTLTFYAKKLSLFFSFCEAQQVRYISQIDVEHLRRFFVWLEETGHNKGGRHAYFRTLRTFFRWLEQEIDGFKSPLARLKPPKLDIEPVQGITSSEVTALIATCESDSFADRRDKALLLLLFDSGLRIEEALNLTWSDIDLVNHTLLVRRGKGGKPRPGFFSPETRRALIAYSKMCDEGQKFVWITANTKQRLSYWGVRSMLFRRAKKANLESVPSPHDFRRGAALSMLRSGADPVSVSRILGHSSLDVTARYLKQVENDLREVHNQTSPVKALKGQSGRKSR
jgi:integrase/recombinase XerD